ncbi:MAG: hypothetical protein AAGH92_07590 [Planctomycetota bacterium]
MNGPRHRVEGASRRAMAVLLVVLTAAIGAPACEKLEEPELDLENLYSYTPAPLAVLLSATWVNGRINYPVIARDYADYVDRFIELAADAGPRTSPQVYFDRRHRAAYYVNVHNGLILQTWIKNGATAGDTTLRFDPAWREEQVHMIDGRLVSINDVADMALAEDYPLIPFVLASGTISGPPIPETTLPAETFERSLAEQVHVYFADARPIRRIAKPDGSGSAFIGPPILEQYADRFGDFEALLDRFVPSTYPHKVDLLRATHEGELRFSEASDIIDLPGATLSPNE